MPTQAQQPTQQQKVENVEFKGFPTLLRKFDAKPSPSGSPIYEWKYRDESGKIKTDKINLYEKIQSYSRQVDYKAKIKRGEDINDGNGIYLDTTKLGTDYNSINEYLAGIVADLKKDLQSYEHQQTTGQNNTESPKVTSESEETDNKGGNNE